MWTPGWGGQSSRSPWPAGKYVLLETLLEAAEASSDTGSDHRRPSGSCGMSNGNGQQGPQSGPLSPALTLLSAQWPPPWSVLQV